MKKILFLTTVLAAFAGSFAQIQNLSASAALSQVPKHTLADTNYLTIAKAVHKLVNEYRAKNGMEPLKMQRELNEIAFEHSLKMAKGQVAFSHTDFNVRVKKIDKYANIPYHTAENLYAHTNISASKFPAAALKGWFNSKGHKKNMEGEFLHTGLGVARSASGEYFVTQLFVGKATFLLAHAKGVDGYEDPNKEDETTGIVAPPQAEMED